MVERIPQSFESVDHYLGSFLLPLLEETRADIAASLKDIDKAPFAQLISFDEVKPNGSLVFDVTVDYWKNKCSDGRVPYRTSPGDIVVISKAKPEAATDLQQSGYWAFASVTDVSEKENQQDVSFKVRVPSCGFVKVACFHIVFLVNVMPFSRVWSALRMRKNLNLLEQVLCPVPEKQIERKCDVCSEYYRPVGEVTSGLLSNVATARVASHLVKLVRESYQNEFDTFCPLEDILLVGNKNSEDGEDITEISLDHRVNMLLKECEAVIPLPNRGLKHVVLAGDEYHLSAIDKSRISHEAGIGRSLFERLGSLGHAKHLLNVQYRMHPSISQFPNSIFYRKQILDAPDMYPGERLDNLGHRRNLVEVALVMQIVQGLFKALSTSKKKLRIGVISPYAAQVLAIQDRLGQKYNNHSHFEVNVKTIAGSIGFLSSLHWTNVALTRARCGSNCYSASSQFG
ncbi:hypothetical protein HAX54_025929 [Datura stramonium]|uniref:DNA2/NAM7 helicase-like C-terminal domain-containing protein n=1 Tax=Datura stramonium TaxID=4076 RepID=A0ABS8V2J3_DATST|nr:hypothetical protein [Datura stramonium]